MDRNPGAPPLYAQLEQILKQQIECGTYKKGDFLPTEKELMEKYELSRVTAVSYTHLCGQSAVCGENSGNDPPCITGRTC